MICNIQEKHAFISLPEILFDYPKLENIVLEYKQQNIKITIRNLKNIITLDIYDEDVSLIIREIFTKYHNIDINFLGHWMPVKQSSKPLVSCIILLNANYDFVNELSIPGILFNSKDYPIEIIVVHNGTEKHFSKREGVKYIESETSHLPKAYNNAAEVAIGDYLAFFHDDCFLSDEDWIEKSIKNLNDEVIAVGPEYHKFIDNEDYKLRKDTDMQREFRNEDGGFLKEVPLVMEREKFWELNGFPDKEIFGQEDIFLHQNILNSGRKNLQIDIKNYHFEGISTLSLFSTKKDLIQNLCNHFIFSRDILRGLIKYGFTTAITERIDLCTKLFRNDLYDEEFSSMCEKIEELGSAEDLDMMTPNFRNEHKRTKAFIDGTVKAFVTLSDTKSLEIIDNFVDFNEVLFNYINVIKNNA